jgi:hypothetical protein
VKKILVSVCLIIFLFKPLAAMAWATRKGYEMVLNTWVGSDADRLVPSWGVPNSVYPLSNGGKALTYMTNTSTGGSAVPIGNTYMFVKREWYCKVTFMVDAGNRISSWTYQGNNCRAATPKEPKSHVTTESSSTSTSRDGHASSIPNLRKFNSNLKDDSL